MIAFTPSSTTSPVLSAKAKPLGPSENTLGAGASSAAAIIPLTPSSRTLVDSSARAIAVPPLPPPEGAGSAAITSPAASPPLAASFPALRTLAELASNPSPIISGAAKATSVIVSFLASTLSSRDSI